MKSRLISLCLIPLLLAAFFAPAPLNAAGQAAAQVPVILQGQADPFSPSARRALAAQAADQKADFIITLSDQLALPPAGGLLSPLQAQASAQSTRQARQKVVIESLQSHAAVSQASLLAQAQGLQVAGLVEGIQPFWIFNGVSLRATPGAIRALAAQPGIARITPDPDPDVPLVLLDDPKSTQDAAAAIPEPNVALVNAPALWAMGYTGQNVVIASLDTGVDATHPDLASSYRGGTDSWYDPYAQNAAPADFNGHGTETMGLMVGDSAGGTAIGIAPGVKWIAAKIFDNSTHYTNEAVHLAMQWVLNPNHDSANPGAPDVVNNSWGYATGGVCDVTFQPDLLALQAAGIVPVFSSGNSGPFSPSDVSPANNAGAFAVGAIDNNNTIASFSSRGPSSCNLNYSYPAVVAPGVTINTTALHGLYTTCTGTSCAAPAVTGGIALLLSAIPHLGLTQQEQAITSGAHDLGDPGYDTTFGYGRLDLLASLNWLTGPQQLLLIPALLEAHFVSPTQIDLSWRDNNLANATGYEVDRSPDGLTGWTTLTTTASGVTSYSDTTASIATYYYRVRAVNSTLATASPYAYTQAPTPLLAPTGFTATAVSPTQIDLAWSDNNLANATGYEVDRSPDGLTGWATLTTTASGATSYSDTTVSEGTIYYYRVRAVNSILSTASSYAFVQAVAPLLAPTNLNASAVSAVQIDLAWSNASAHASGVEIQRSPDGLTDWTTLAADVLGTTFSDTSGLAEGTAYFYRVRAVNPALGAAAGSTYVSAGAITLLYPPILNALPISTTEIALYWTNFSAHATGFELQRSPDGLTGWTTIAAVSLDVTRVFNSGLTPLSVYYYRLRVVGSPTDSNYSAVVSMTTAPYVYRLPMIFRGP